MLASNTSDTESAFSVVRGLGGRDAVTYATRIGCRSLQDAFRAIKSSTSYSVEETIPRTGPLDVRLFDLKQVRSMNEMVRGFKKAWVNHFVSPPGIPETELHIPIIFEKTMWPATPQQVTNPLTVKAYDLLAGKRLRKNFSTMLATETSLPDYYVLSILSGRDGLFQRLSQLSSTEEVTFNKDCQWAISELLPVVATALLRTATYATKLELAAVNHVNAYISAIMKREKTNKLKAKRIQKPAAGYETGCFNFIQGSKMKTFMADLPVGLQEDRLFAGCILECLWNAASSWIVDAVQSLPREAMPCVDTVRERTTISTALGIDQDSEVHRFVASGVVANNKIFSKELKRFKTKIKESASAKSVVKPTIRTNRAKQIQLIKHIQKLLAKVGVLRGDLAPIRDKSYDTPALIARDHGGLLLVAPVFLEWAKALMKTIRASVGVESIGRIGSPVQKQAYTRIVKDQELWIAFLEACQRSGDYPQEAVQKVYRHLVDYSFHARSEVEWLKYRELNTDRTAGKDKKMGRREMLKASGGEKKAEGTPEAISNK
jgi:hypothetical protein